MVKQMTEMLKGTLEGIVLAILADSEVFAGEETFGKSRISALIWQTTAVKFSSLANPLAISVSGDSGSMEIQAIALGKAREGGI